MNPTLISAISKTFRFFGYSISGSLRNCKTMKRARPVTNPFTLQANLIDTKNPVIFDVGAHIGQTCKIYRNKFPRAKIYCFEPFPESFIELSKNQIPGSNTFCHQVALSDSTGKALLNANINSATNSLLETDKRGASIWGEGLLDTISQVTVDTTTIDDFSQSNNISGIDILKMDAQGAEFSILKGAHEMLKGQKISLIYTEMILHPTYHRQHKLHEYLSFLDSLDYELLNVFNLEMTGNKLVQADIVFVSSSLS